MSDVIITGCMYGGVLLGSAEKTIIIAVMTKIQNYKSTNLINLTEMK